jgi:hypothetical protein
MQYIQFFWNTAFQTLKGLYSGQELLYSGVEFCLLNVHDTSNYLQAHLWISMYNSEVIKGVFYSEIAREHVTPKFRKQKPHTIKPQSMRNFINSAGRLSNWTKNRKPPSELMVTHRD